MKYLSYSFILCLFCLFSCKTAETENSDTERSVPATASETPEWVQYVGSEGPGLGKHIVLVTGDEEYRSEEAMPMMGKILADHHGFTCTVLFAQDPAKPGIVNPNYLNHIPGLEALDDADLMFLFTRFRELPDAQMKHIDDYLMSGRPVIGIRTATHAFNIKDSTSNWLHYTNSYQGDNDAWTDGFGRVVLGEKWISHHGHHKHQSTRGKIAPGAENHPILNGIGDGEIWGPTDVYGVRLPLPGDAQPLVLGQVVNRAGEFNEEDRLYGLAESDTEVATVNPRREKQGDPNDPMMPIAWSKSYQLPGGQTGKTFASTLGSSTDLLDEESRRMYVNAVFWLLGMEAPEKANVEIVGTYEPTAYNFRTDEYWAERGMKVAEHLWEE